MWDEIQEEEELKPIKLFDDDISGNGIYLHKSGHRVKVEPFKGNGLYLTPQSRLAGVSGDGLINRRWERFAPRIQKPF